VRDWRLRPRFSDFDFIHLAAAKVLDAAGLTALARRIEDSAAVQAIDRLNLDGLLTLWHPSASN
jgi:protease-4